MTTVTAMTAARAQQIEDESIVNGLVTAGHLILTRHDGTPIDAGPVLGPAGPAGPAGPTSIAVATSVTRPVGGALFAGLGLFETDTKRFYIYDGVGWVYRGGTWICTSSTRPAAPFVGLTIFETDTGNVMTYQSAATGWTPPWNLAWGILGQTPNAVSPAPFSALTDLAVAPAIVFKANRLVELAVKWNGGVGGNSVDIFDFRIMEGAAVIDSITQGMKQNGVFWVDGNAFSTIVTPTAGAHTYKLAAARNSGTGTIQMSNGAGSPNRIVVKDLGPAGPPA